MWRQRSDDPTIRRSPGTINVGIFGGSVAYWFSVQGNDALVRELSKIPEYQGKESRIIRVALGGFKQPQQLLALNYFLALDGQFDILINLDGFNEIALPFLENLRRDVSPFYPRNWDVRVSGIPDPIQRRLGGQLSYLENERRELALRFTKMPFSGTAISAVFWALLDRIHAGQEAVAAEALLAYKPKKRRYISHGPPHGLHFENETALFRDLARVWESSSLQLSRICEANDIRYFHFLQPNQYFEDSKPMSPEEKTVAIVRPSRAATAVEKGYPLLLEGSNRLLSHGVAFHTLTGIYSRVADPIYIDNMCHVNHEGNRILGESIGRLIASSLAGG